MRDAVAREMQWAARTFEANWHHIAPLVGGGILIPNEDATTKQTSQLDLISGIDWFIQQRLSNGLTINIPLAARVQIVGRAWASFTCRENRRTGGITELQRRINELATPGAATPHLNCQLYVQEFE